MLPPSSKPVLRRVELINFKAFRRFSATFQHSAYIVGPNNAGKSTIISAIRSGALMLRLATRRNPTEIVRYKDEEFHGYPIQTGAFALVDENLRHEFSQEETRLVLHFRNKARLTAVWPTSVGPQSAIFWRCTSGAMNDSPSRPARRLTRT